MHGDWREELEREDSRLDNTDRWVRELGFWMGLLAFLFLVWVLIATWVIP